MPNRSLTKKRFSAELQKISAKVNKEMQLALTSVQMSEEQYVRLMSAPKKAKQK